MSASPAKVAEGAAKKTAIDVPATATSAASEPLNELSIVEGALARPMDISLKNSLSNQRAMRLEGGLALTAYMVSSMTQVVGQSTWVHSLSMMAAGTSFLICAAQRYSTGPTENYQLQAAAGSIWMLSSFQLFHQYRKMKWCGLSSWMGFFVLSGYGFAELLRTMTE